MFHSDLVYISIASRNGFAIGESRHKNATPMSYQLRFEHRIL